jgi:hypothetical protein
VSYYLFFIKLILFRKAFQSIERVFGSLESYWDIQNTELSQEERMSLIKNMTLLLMKLTISYSESTQKTFHKLNHFAKYFFTISNQIMLHNRIDFSSSLYSIFSFSLSLFTLTLISLAICFFSNFTLQSTYHVSRTHTLIFRNWAISDGRKGLTFLKSFIVSVVPLLTLMSSLSPTTERYKLIQINDLTILQEKMRDLLSDTVSGF